MALRAGWNEGDVVRFTSPQYLILLLVGCAWLWQAWRRAHSAHERRGSRRHAARAAIAVLLILGAAGLEIAAGPTAVSVMFVMDVSDSVAGARAEMSRRVDAMLAQLQRGDRAGLILFGAEPIIERSVGTLVDANAATDAVVQTTATDIEAALRLARSALPATGLRRIVLLSDGQQTRGDALREASRAAANGVPIDIAPPVEANLAPSPVLTRVSAPPVVGVGEPFQISLLAEGLPGEAAVLSIQGESGEPATQHVRFSPNGVATAAQVIRENQPGVYVYRAGLSLARPDPLGAGSETSDGAVVVVSGRPRVLSVGPLRGVDRLLSASFTVNHISATDVPRSAAALASYDAVILEGVRPDVLDEEQTAALTRHIETRGSGLVVLGDATTLDATIAPATGLGRLLPIDVRPRAGTRAPELALVVVFDKSGSMDDRVGGQAKIEYARQGVQRVLDALPATDALGVIAFDNAPTVIAPLAIGHAAREISERLRGVAPIGSTAIAPAVQRAIEWLSTDEIGRIPRRHVLLVTDGRSSPADAARLQAIVKESHLPLSIISLGGNRDQEFLQSLAESTGSRAYFPQDARALPELAAREATLVAGGRLVEEPFTPQGMPHPITVGLTNGRLPRLGGYVVSAAKPGAEIVLASHRLDPILATWRYGLGKIAVYTADLDGPWSMQFRSSEVFEPFVRDMVRWVARSTSDQSFFVRIQKRTDHAELIVEAPRVDSSYASLLEVRASLRRPSGDTEHLRLAETMPGRYATSVAVSEPGPYIVAIDGRGRDSRFTAQELRGFYWSGNTERHGTNTALLSRVRDVTNGTTIDGDSSAFAARPPAFQDARPWIFTAAFLLFLIEILTADLRTVSGRHKGDAPDSIPRRTAA
jgi:Mg-chelatase subunit ChlD